MLGYGRRPRDRINAGEKLQKASPFRSSFGVINLPDPPFSDDLSRIVRDLQLTKSQFPTRDCGRPGRSVRLAQRSMLSAGHSWPLAIVPAWREPSSSPSDSPAYDAGRIQQKFRWPGDVVFVKTGFDVEQVIPRDHLRVRIRQKRIRIALLRAQLSRDLWRIHADCRDPDPRASSSPECRSYSATRSCTRVTSSLYKRPASRPLAQPRATVGSQDSNDIGFLAVSSNVKSGALVPTCGATEDAGICRPTTKTEKIKSPATNTLRPAK